MRVNLRYERRWQAPLLLLLLAGLVACGQAPSPSDARVTGVTVSPASIGLEVGATRTLSATVSGTGAIDTTVTWSSDDETVATVDATGTVTALAVGNAVLTAASNQDPAKEGSAQVVVTGTGEQAVDWTVQWGTPEYEAASAVAVDSQGAVVVVGATNGALFEQNAGLNDAYVIKYSPAGVAEWGDQFGTASNDHATAVAIDANDNVYIAGITSGSLAAPIAGVADAFVRMYSPDGTVVWTEQFGSDERDAALGLAIDGRGDVIVAGTGYRAIDPENWVGVPGFVSKYELREDGLGLTEVWTHLVDVTIDAVAVDSDDNVVGLGTYTLEEHANELYLLKLDPEGIEVWSAMFGTGVQPGSEGGQRDEVPDTRWPKELWEELGDANETGYAVAVDPTGNVYATGYAGGFDTGSGIIRYKPVVLKLDPNGVELWARLFSDEHAPYGSYGAGIAVSEAGEIALVGNTGSFYDVRSPAGTEMFVRHLTTDGALLREEAFGDSGWDTVAAVALDPEGGVLAAGSTLGDLGAENEGNVDAFLRRYAP